MTLESLVNEAKELFDDKKHSEAIQKLNKAFKIIRKNNNYTDNHLKTLSEIATLYFKIAKEQSQKNKEITKSTLSYKKILTLINNEHNADFTLEKVKVNLAIIINYLNIQEKDSINYLLKAIDFLNLALKKSENLKDTEEKINKQFLIIGWLVICFIKISIKIKNEISAVTKYKQSQNHLKRFEELVPKVKNGKTKEKELLSVLKTICFQATSKKQLKYLDYREVYLNIKKEQIKKELFKGKNHSLIPSISMILALLNIPPNELKKIPLAHYTSPNVCNKLFNIQSNEPAGENKSESLMRIGSSTYMNDPSEGKGLLELLNIPEWELENKAYCSTSNAFFTCFSNRINDLNQFRLYGKEDGVEASGCCLVFNKKGNWLKEPNISSSFLGIMGKTTSSLNIEKIERPTKNENLPLYQVAYIAYKDEYISDENFDILLPDQNNPKFGIRLKSVGANKNWHKFRIKQLEKVLCELITYFKDKKSIKNNEIYYLEYIRYLFKDFAFRDEEEFRLLKIVPMNSEEIEYCENTNSIYLPYANVQNMVDEVILGTNYEKTNRKRKIEVFQHLMKKHPNVIISRSSLPIYANPPIGKN